MKKIFFAALIPALFMLASIAALGDDWKSYSNKDLGFSFEYPDIYDGPSENTSGDGVFSFNASRDKNSLIVEYTKNDGQATPESKLKEWTSLDEDEYGYVYGVEPISGTAKSGDNFFTLDYLNDSAGVDDKGAPACITHIYGIVTKKAVLTLTLTYPKEDAGKFTEIVSRADKSLKATEQ